MNAVSSLVLCAGRADELCRCLEEILKAHLPKRTRIKRLRLDAESLWTSLSDALSVAVQFQPDLVFLAFTEGDRHDASRLIQGVKSSLAHAPLVVVTDYCDPVEMLELLRVGASDFATTPLKAVEIIPRVERLVERQSTTKIDPDGSLKEKLGLRQIVGESAAFKAVVEQLPMLAKCDASALIVGETGTGKELCARAIHYLSPRSRKAFVPVNCGAIPTDLVENELFGHDREAFTGASTSRIGLVQESDGGTLFLDEIDCLPLLAQVKLLRFLQDREYRPLGASKSRYADVRVIAASNVDIAGAVGSGRLRQDFYYRLNVVQLALPALRERPEDIPVLAAHFLDKYSARFNKRITGYSNDAMQQLMAYDWPGNVRELEHVVERGVVLSEGETLGSASICLSGSTAPSPIESFREKKAHVIGQFERTYLQSLLRAFRGNVTRAAEAARKDRRALRHLIRKHKIDVNSFRDRPN